MESLQTLKEIIRLTPCATEEEIEAHDKKQALDAAIAQEALRFKGLPKWWTACNYEARTNESGDVPYQGLVDLMSDIEAGSVLKNVVLMGPTDSGKSHAAVALARLYSRQGLTVWRETEPELNQCWSMYRYSKSDIIANRMHEAIHADVLVYDDIGKCQIANGLMLTEFGSFVFSIFDKRAEARKLNIITTRYESLEELAKVTGGDLIRRIRQNEKQDKSRSAVFTYKNGG